MAGRNLKTDQLEFSKLIVSGTRFLVYSSSVSSDVTGNVDSSLFAFNGIGTDVFAFFSGVVGSANTTTRGTYVFAGDVFFSGSARGTSGISGELASKSLVAIAVNESTHVSGVYVVAGGYRFNPNDYASTDQTTSIKFVSVASVTSASLHGDVILFDMTSSVETSKLSFTDVAMKAPTRLSSSNLTLSGSDTMYEVRIRVLSGATVDDRVLCAWAGFEVTNHWL